MAVKLLPSFIMESPSTGRRLSAPLILLTLGLGVGAGLFYRQSTTTSERQQFLGTINQLSNAWHDARLKLDEQKLVNVSLERDLSLALESANSYSNKIGTVRAAPGKSGVDRNTSPALSPKPDPRVAELQDERDSLVTKLSDLTSAMAKLDCDKAEVERRLEASESDRDALVQELKRIEAERSRLMMQFNNLALVREQYRKLKAEQSVSRRLDWIRRGMYGDSKGAELLHKGLASAGPGSGNYDLNVELHRTR
jgi:chromosome segregation ATPase